MFAILVKWSLPVFLLLLLAAGRGTTSAYAQGAPWGLAEKSGKEKPKADAPGPRTPTREATDAPDLGRLDPEEVLKEVDGLPVFVREKRLADGRLRSRVYVAQVEREDGTTEEVFHGPQFHWHPNRTLWMQRVYRRGIQTGPYREWNVAGLLQIRGDFVEDQPHGTWEKFHEDGFLLRTREWDHGKRVGLTTNWHPNGRIRRTTTWKEGMPSGPQESFHRNGQLSERGELKLGKRVGVWERFHANGQPEIRVTYGEGEKRTGPYKEWSDKGELVSEGSFKQGKREGAWFQARLREGLELRESYSAGRLDGVCKTYLAGGATVIEEASYREGRAFGTLKSWYEDGSPKTEQELPAEEGGACAWRWFYPGGQVACEGQLVDGVRSGEWRFYSSAGELDPKWSGIYESGWRRAALPN